MREIVKMRFLGGKRSPGKVMIAGKLTPLVVGQIYELPESIADAFYFEVVGKEKPQPPPQAPAQTSEQSVYEPPEDEDKEEANKAFQEHIEESGLPFIPLGETEELTPSPPPPAPVPVEEISVDSKRKSLMQKTKPELVKIITERGGTANKGMLKAVLVEAALSLGAS